MHLPKQYYILFVCMVYDQGVLTFWRVSGPCLFAIHYRQKLYNYEMTKTNVSVKMHV